MRDNRRSAEELGAYARNQDFTHARAWAAFNRSAAATGDVGIFHETYRVGPGRVETLYGNMPPFGLAAAVGDAPIASRGQSAGHRMDQAVPDMPAVEPY